MGAKFWKHHIDEKDGCGHWHKRNTRGKCYCSGEPGIPAERPKSPKLWLNLAAGVFACSLMGFLVSVIWTLLDDRLNSPQTVATMTNLPCVATTRPPGFFSRKIKNAAPQA